MMSIIFRCIIPFRINIRTLSLNHLDLFFWCWYNNEKDLLQRNQILMGFIHWWWNRSTLVSSIFLPPLEYCYRYYVATFIFYCIWIFRQIYAIPRRIETLWETYQNYNFGLFREIIYILRQGYDRNLIFICIFLKTKYRVLFDFPQLKGWVF